MDLILTTYHMGATSISSKPLRCLKAPLSQLHKALLGFRVIGFRVYSSGTSPQKDLTGLLVINRF